MTFDVQIGDTLYPLVRDVTHQHPSAVHEHLGTDTTTIDPEVTLQRLLDALAADDWFTDDGRYLGRDMFGIGIQGHP